ncbi:MAG: FHA domain-containing protein [Limisphaerales bacterium]
MSRRVENPYWTADNDRDKPRRTRRYSPPPTPASTLIDPPIVTPPPPSLHSSPPFEAPRVAERSVPPVPSPSKRNRAPLPAFRPGIPRRQTAWRDHFRTLIGEATRRLVRPADAARELLRRFPRRTVQKAQLCILPRPGAATGEPAQVDIDRFPFRIGRHSISPEEGATPELELALQDFSPFNVSRMHCSIERQGRDLLVHDSTSTLGTVVNGVRIGRKQATATARLVPGFNLLILGRADSSVHLVLRID